MNNTQETENIHRLLKMIGRSISERPLIELALGFIRYEALRKLNPSQYRELYERNLTGENFDRMVDNLVLDKTTI